MISILVAMHKNFWLASDDIYIPIYVGSEKNVNSLNVNKDFYKDNDGGDDVKEISLRNYTYCEMTAVYWAWKNLKTDYIGLCHYSRYFGEKKNHRCPDDSDVYDAAKYENILKMYPIIVPNLESIDAGKNVYDNYKIRHHIEDLDLCRLVIKDKYPEYIAAFDTVMESNELHFYNMFVMRKDVLHSYCEWIFNILFEVEKRIDYSKYDAYQRRVMGFLAERLFNVWLIYHKEIPIFNMPVSNVGYIKSRWTWYRDKVLNLLRIKNKIN